MVRLEDLSGQQVAVYNYVIAASKLRKRSVSNFYRHKCLTAIGAATDGFNARFLNALNDSVVLRALQTLSSPDVDALRSLVLPSKQIPRRPRRTRRPTGKPKQLPDNPESADVVADCVVIGDGRRTPEYPCQFQLDVDELENSPVFDTRPNSRPTPPPVVQRQVCSKKRKFEPVERENPPPSAGECVPAVHISTNKLPSLHALVTDRPSPSRRRLSAFSARRKLNGSASQGSFVDEGIPDARMTPKKGTTTKRLFRRDQNKLEFSPDEKVGSDDDQDPVKSVVRSLKKRK